MDNNKIQPSDANVIAEISVSLLEGENWGPADKYKITNGHSDPAARYVTLKSELAEAAMQKMQGETFFVRENSPGIASPSSNIIAPKKIMFKIRPTPRNG